MILARTVSTGSRLQSPQARQIQFQAVAETRASRTPEKSNNSLNYISTTLIHEATPEDLLYEILIKAGFMPTEKIQTITLSPARRYFPLPRERLLICLGDTVTKELIDAVAEAEPMQFICLIPLFTVTINSKPTLCKPLPPAICRRKSIIRLYSRQYKEAMRV